MIPPRVVGEPEAHKSGHWDVIDAGREIHLLKSEGGGHSSREKGHQTDVPIKMI